MSQPFQPGAGASTNSRDSVYPFVPSSQGNGGGDRGGVGHLNPSPQNEKVRHLMYGSPVAVRMEIKTLHHLGFAEPNEWSRLMPTPRPGEVMCILTRTVQT